MTGSLIQLKLPKPHSPQSEDNTLTYASKPRWDLSDSVVRECRAPFGTVLSKQPLLLNDRHQITSTIIYSSFAEKKGYCRRYPTFEHVWLTTQHLPQAIRSGYKQDSLDSGLTPATRDFTDPWLGRTPFVIASFMFARLYTTRLLGSAQGKGLGISGYNWLMIYFSISLFLFLKLTRWSNAGILFDLMMLSSARWPLVYDERGSTIHHACSRY